jgi:hypothetical protein
MNGNVLLQFDRWVSHAFKVLYGFFFKVCYDCILVLQVLNYFPDPWQAGMEFSQYSIRKVHEMKYLYDFQLVCSPEYIVMPDKGIHGLLSQKGYRFWRRNLLEMHL